MWCISELATASHSRDLHRDYYPSTYYHEDKGNSHALTVPWGLWWLLEKTDFLQRCLYQWGAACLPLNNPNSESLQKKCIDVEWGASWEEKENNQEEEVTTGRGQQEEYE